MPELPEVETIKKQLSTHLPFTINEVSTTPELKKNILHTKLDLKNKTIKKISRKGKMLDFILDDDSHLLSHLGMTGTWLIGKNVKTTKHSHLILKSDDETLVYDDPRRFGHLYHLNKIEAEKKMQSLGMDLSDVNFSLEYLTAALKKYPNRQLKVTLLDQKLFAGSGNYIANEICARAKITPLRLCKNIKKYEYKNIILAIKKVLKPALDAGGTTFQGGYRDTTGNRGSGLSHLVVFYQKICQQCKKTPIKKVILAARGTYYCPNCQK